MLRRYSLLSEVFEKMLSDNDSGLSPIPAGEATEIMNVRQNLITTYSYMRVIRDANDNVMPQSVKDKYEEKFNKVRRYFDGSADIFTDRNKLLNLQNRVLELNRELKDIGDRYVFYRLLMEVQQQEINYNNRTQGNSKQVVNRPYGPGGGSVGYDSFMSSTTVQSDINNGNEYVILDINEYGPGVKTKEPSLQVNENYAFCHAQVIAINPHDDKRDPVYVPAIGTRNIGYHFECGFGRWLQWKVIVRVMYFAEDIYPFKGLIR